MFYFFLLIFLLNDGFSMMRHYSPYLRDLRQRIIDRMTHTRFVVVHSIIDLSCVIGMAWSFNSKYNLYAIVVVGIIMIVWYIPLGWRKYKK